MRDRGLWGSGHGRRFHFDARGSSCQKENPISATGHFSHWPFLWLPLIMEPQAPETRRFPFMLKNLSLSIFLSSGNFGVGIKAW